MLRTITLLALLPAFAVAEMRRGEAPPAGLIEQVEIMRVVLTKQLNGGLPGSEEDRLAAFGFTEGIPLLSEQFEGARLAEARERRYAAYGDLFTGGAAVQRTKHSRGFYVPGAGAIFDTEIELPVERVYEKAAPAADLWEEARHEVKKGGAGDPTYFSATRATIVNFRLDESEIERTVDRVVELIRVYGPRLELLPADEKIIVALQMRPNQAYHFPAITSNEEGAAVTHVVVKGVTVVVSASKRAVQDAIDGEGSGGFRERVQITRY